MLVSNQHGLVPTIGLRPDRLGIAACLAHRRTEAPSDYDGSAFKQARPNGRPTLDYVR